ncbi:hypothetical protein [Xanthomonas translucens]|uniref:hypothetical protein n=2 Tax=Xanthomonas campestris pv. translucens TaxID=343 RepID=UPI00114D1DAB|nr:hypothetical protein [Xanthomonas translucens]QEN93610.1 hypothetical protein F0H33_09675 [Xanthomonas translucens pv. undulosa]
MMRALALLRVLACGLALGFLADLLRRCVIVEAWSVGPIVAALLALALIATRWSWRAARRPRLPTDFVRPNTPDFPDQPRCGIR